jgi:hypothetical protein
MLWNVCWKPNLWSQQRHSLLENGSANMGVARQWLTKQQTTAFPLYARSNRRNVGRGIFCAVRAEATSLDLASRVEVGSNTSTVSLRVVGGDENQPSVWGYNCLFLGDINTGTWPSRLGSLESETVKYGHEFRRSRTWEWLRWRGPAAIVNHRSILPWERILHEDYNCKYSVGKWNYCVVSLKGLVDKTNWLAVNRQS